MEPSVYDHIENNDSTKVDSGGFERDNIEYAECDITKVLMYKTKTLSIAKLMESSLNESDDEKDCTVVESMLSFYKTQANLQKLRVFFFLSKT